MKKIIVLLILAFIFSCQNEKNNSKPKELLGNWSVLKNDSTYYEINIDSSNIQFYNYDLSFLPLRPYQIENDTIFMRYSNNERKKRAYSIKQLDDLSFVLKNNKSKVILKLFRIDSLEFTFDKISNYEKEQLKFEVAHLNRKNKLLGIDYHYNLDSVTKAFQEMKVPKTETIE